MKNRLQDDVAAMVKDRRSGSGGKGNGGPPHLPTPPVAASQISGDELAMVRHLADEKAAAAAFYERAQAAEEAGMRHLIRKYALVGQDSVSLESGAIVRAERPESPGK